jgi:drug/metabolite transporter (DMT)-like permease
VAGASVFLGERPMPLQAIGAALIIGGVVLTRGAAGRRGSGAEPAVPVR